MKIDKNLRGVSGVYKIENLETKECYIGSTLNIYNRAHSYKCLGRQNKAHSSNLQNAINEYGINTFILEVLEKVYFEDNITKNEKLKILHDKEQLYSDNTFLKYNRRKDIDKNTGIKQSEDTKKKVSVTLKRIFGDGTRIIGRIYSHNIKVSLFAMNGKFIQDFPGLAHCAEYVGVDPVSIGYAIKSKRHVVKNYIVLKTEDSHKIHDFVGIPINKNTGGKSIKIMNIDTNEIFSFINCKICAETIGCMSNTIINCYKTNRLVKKKYKILEYECIRKRH